MKNAEKIFKESGYIQYILNNSKAGHAWAQKAMGDIYHFGIGMEEDLNKMGAEEKHQKIDDNHKEAFEWYKKAAEQGEPDAMHAVGSIYFFEVDDDKKAVEWYNKAVDAGNAKALNSLAQMYEKGWGVNRSLSKAKKLYADAIFEHLHKDSIYPWARLCLENLEENDNLGMILRLLLVAKQVDVNIAASEYASAADWAIKHYDLWNRVSSFDRKQIWDDARNDVLMNWDVAIQHALVSGIRQKTAIIEPPFKPIRAEDVFEKIWRSVVYIETPDSSGSGVIVQPGIVATNHHVVRGANAIRVFQPKEKSGREDIYYPVSGSPVQAKEDEDYCILHVPLLPGAGVPAAIRCYNTLKVGETVYALGAPKGEPLSFSQGIISQKRDVMLYPEGYKPTRAIQSDASDDVGSSGGGLFDSSGNLIGHTTFGDKDNTEVLGFSIPADIILDFAQEEENKK